MSSAHPYEQFAVLEPADEALEAGTRVIGDLHLDPGGEARIADFVRWLEELRDCPRLIILGDLFDYWIGPAQARESGAREVVLGLASLRARGTRIDLLHGNRDFLIGAEFERRSGARVLRGGLLLGAAEAAGERVLFIHGDELCTLDLPYQRLRRTLRSGPVRLLLRLLPYSLAHWTARRLRRASQAAVPRKTEESRSMQVGEVRHIAAALAAGTLVCGHAHSFRDEQLDGGPRWLVLDAWGGVSPVLLVTGAGLIAESGQRG